MLHEGDIHRALFVHLRGTLLHFFQPLGGRLDGEMRRIVSEVKKEGLVVGCCPLVQILGCSIREEVGGMTLWLDDLHVIPHVVNSLPPVGGVTIHHVAEKSVE